MPRDFAAKTRLRSLRAARNPRHWCLRAHAQREAAPRRCRCSCGRALQSLDEQQRLALKMMHCGSAPPLPRANPRDEKGCRPSGATGLVVSSGECAATATGAVLVRGRSHPATGTCAGPTHLGSRRLSSRATHPQRKLEQQAPGLCCGPQQPPAHRQWNRRPQAASRPSGKAEGSPSGTFCTRAPHVFAQTQAADGDVDVLRQPRHLSLNHGSRCAERARSGTA
mmetsp:Transcript_21554/g.54367  ORF Transcript_21554/g.54367 Transcript_21554/m.54367 type:complete len:224 (+) Transcript_21554:875-1546(+)